MARTPRAITRTSAVGPVFPTINVNGIERQLVSQKSFWEVTYRKPVGATIAEARKAAKAATAHVLRWWHRNRLPRHFEQGAGSVYHYQRRTGFTYREKIEKYGHNKPIVAKGVSRAMLLAQAQVSVVGEFGKLRMRGGFYLGIRRLRKDNKLSPDLKAEIATVTDQEVNEMAGIARAKIAKDVTNFERVERKRLPA